MSEKSGDQVAAKAYRAPHTLTSGGVPLIGGGPACGWGLGGLELTMERSLMFCLGEYKRNSEMEYFPSQDIVIFAGAKGVLFSW